MTRYLVTWHWNGQKYLATYDSLIGAELMRLSLLDHKLNINEVDIQLIEQKVENDNQDSL